MKLPKNTKDSIEATFFVVLLVLFFFAIYYIGEHYPCIGVAVSLVFLVVYYGIKLERI